MADPADRSGDRGHRGNVATGRAARGWGGCGSGGFSAYEVVLILGRAGIME